MNKQQEPRLRFQGFAGAWEEKKLGDMADIVRGASPRPIQDPKWFDDNSDIGWLRISDVTTQNGRIHYLEQKISKAGQEKTRVIEMPHLLLSIAASVGKPVINYVKTGVHDGFLVFKNPNFELEFMFQYLDSFVDTWQSYGQPGTQVNLNSNIVKNTEFLVPAIPEQTAIGNFFRRLDSQIAESRAVLEKSRQLKKAMLAKMFPANGEKMPKIRFKGFEGEWKTRSLIDVLEIERKGKAQYQKLQAGNVPYLDAEFINGGVKILTDAVPDVDVNDILIIWDGSNAGKVYTGFNGVLGSTLKSYRTNADCSSMFLYQELVRNEEVIFSQYRTPNIPHVIKDFSDEYNFLMPSYKEQTAIGLFFRQLDETIDLQSAEVEKLNQLKKGLLAAMLV